MRNLSSLLLGFLFTSLAYASGSIGGSKGFVDKPSVTGRLSQAPLMHSENTRQIGELKHASDKFSVEGRLNQHPIMRMENSPQRGELQRYNSDRPTVEMRLKNSK